VSGSILQSTREITLNLISAIHSSGFPIDSGSNRALGTKIEEQQKINQIACEVEPIRPSCRLVRFETIEKRNRGEISAHRCRILLTETTRLRARALPRSLVRSVI